MYPKREYPMVAVLDDLLCVLGGRDPIDGSIFSTQKYDGKRWTHNVDVSFRYGAGACVFKDEVFIFGGVLNSGNKTSNSVVAFNGLMWRDSTPMRYPRAWPAAAVFQSFIFVTGGCCNDTRGVEKFDGFQWTSAPSMLSGRYSHSAFVYNGYLYVGGGNDGFGVNLNKVERFDGATWTLVSSMVTRRFGSQLIVFKGALYALGGGFNGTGAALSDVDVFDGFNAWVPSVPMPVVRTYFSAVVF